MLSHQPSGQDRDKPREQGEVNEDLEQLSLRQDVIGEALFVLLFPVATRNGDNLDVRYSLVESVLDRGNHHYYKIADTPEGVFANDIISYDVYIATDQKNFDTYDPQIPDGLDHIIVRRNTANIQGALMEISLEGVKVLEVPDLESTTSGSSDLALDKDDEAEVLAEVYEFLGLQDEGGSPHHYIRPVGENTAKRKHSFADLSADVLAGLDEEVEEYLRELGDEDDDPFSDVA